MGFEEECHGLHSRLVGVKGAPDNERRQSNIWIQ